MGNQLILAGSTQLSPVVLSPAALFAPTPEARERVVEFFTAGVNNDHTRRAYLNATRRFSAWCAGQGIEHLASVRPVHIAAFLGSEVQWNEKPG